MSYFYLATPYTKYHKGHEAAFHKACEIAADLMNRGMVIYSPIAHSHPIAFGRMDHIDPDLWERLDKPFLDNCAGVIVAKMKGWDESNGVRHEIAECVKAGKPVMYLEVQ